MFGHGTARPTKVRRLQLRACMFRRWKTPGVASVLGMLSRGQREVGMRAALAFSEESLNRQTSKNIKEIG